MQKLYVIICDNCRKIVDVYETVKGKKKILHYCEKCLRKLKLKKLNETKSRR